MQLRQAIPVSLIASALIGCIGSVQAAPIPAGLSVSVSASFDDTNSFASSGSGTQSGQFGISTGGVASNSSFSNVSVSGTNPQNGTATQTGDGASLNFALAGNNLGTSDGTFGDLLLNFSNTGSTGYKATFAVDMLYNNLQATGADAFIKLDFSLLDAGLNEVFFSSRWHDTVNGNSDGDSASNVIDVILNAGDTASFHGIERASGGSFVQGGSYSGDVSATLRLIGFAALTTPPNRLPVPSSLILSLLGLGLMGVKFLKQKNT